MLQKNFTLNGQESESILVSVNYTTLCRGLVSFCSFIAGVCLLVSRRSRSQTRWPLISQKAWS